MRSSSHCAWPLRTIHISIDNRSFTFYADVFYPLSLPRHLHNLTVCMNSPRFLRESVLLIFIVSCVVWACVFAFWVFWCDVRYDFRIKTMFSSFLPPVACGGGGAYIVCGVCVCVCVCVCLFVHTGVQDIFCSALGFFLRLVYPILPVSLDCSFWLPFLIVSSVFSKV
jgi:hypothetical protein